MLVKKRIADSVVASVFYLKYTQLGTFHFVCRSQEVNYNGREKDSQWKVKGLLQSNREAEMTFNTSVGTEKVLPSGYLICCEWTSQF
jgi:hypothetical protein